MVFNVLLVLVLVPFLRPPNGHTVHRHIVKFLEREGLDVVFDPVTNLPVVRWLFWWPMHRLNIARAPWRLVRLKQ